MAASAAAAAKTSSISARSTLDMYERVGTIGRGSFGTVTKIKRKSDGRVLVWKELNYGHMREKEKQLVVSEVNILRELRHPFIVRYYDRIIDKESTRIYIVMEHCEGGDLGRVIKRCRRDKMLLDEDFVWRCFAQMVLALKDCHRHKEPAPGGSCGAAAASVAAGTAADRVKPILHRDLKPGNIFLDGAKNVKIGDFGLAKELASESKYAVTNVGTPFYMSPEQINEQKYNEKSDIWALGCLLYEMCALVPPFEATNHLSLAVKINAGKFARIPSKFSENLYRTVRWMIQVDPSKRPNVEDLERIPALRPFTQEAALMVREHQLGQKYAARVRDAGAKEDALRRREEALRARESAAACKERALEDRERAVAARERAVSDRERSVAGAAATAAANVGPAAYSVSARAGAAVSSSSSSSSASAARAAAHAPRRASGSGGAGHAPSLARATSAPSMQPGRVNPPSIPISGPDNAGAHACRKASNPFSARAVLAYAQPEERSDVSMGCEL